MWSKRNTPPLLVRMQIGTTTLESSMVNSQKIGNHSSSRPSHTTLGHILKECPVIPKGHMLNYVHSSIICNSQNWKQPRCPSTEEWIRKMWYIYTMEYYAAEKNNDIMKFAGKWMELENVILSKIQYIWPYLEGLDSFGVEICADLNLAHYSQAKRLALVQTFPGVTPPKISSIYTGMSTVGIVQILFMQL
ncbi:hypothetical protein STEG23_018075 [Scotinomys teguina]